MDVIPELKKKSGGKGSETLFRVTYQNQISLIRIADNKAHLIISINAGIISVILALTGLNHTINSFEVDNIRMIIPVILLILACLLSTVFAIRSAMPYVKKAKKVNPANPEVRSSLLFFGNISSKTMEGYMSEMKQLILSKDSIHENMIVDIYNQARILTRKYAFLHIAYQIFMYGFIIGVLSFIVFMVL